MHSNKTNGTRLIRLLPAAVLAVAVYVSACEDVTTEPPTRPVPETVLVNSDLSVTEPIQLGTTVQLGAEVRDQYGQVLDAPDVTWESADPKIAEVSPSGVITALAPGTVRITAKAGNAFATLELAVVNGDYVGLLALYFATRGDEWTNNDGWTESLDLSSWHGVETDRDGRVVGLDLQSNNVVGELPSEFTGLSKLTNLDLSNNGLTGEVPTLLGDLESLEVLNLSGNGLSGPIPPGLADIKGLQKLILRFNSLSGTIPVELAEASALVEIDLSSNDLSGEIPSELGGLENLEVLSLGFNQLTGAIPSELSALASLETLWLWNNQLSGSVPYAFGQLTNLKSLLIGSNDDLSGPLTVALSNAQLEVLGYGETDLCLPRYAPFRTYLESVSVHTGSDVDCAKNDAPELRQGIVVPSGGHYVVSVRTNVIFPNFFIASFFEDPDGDPLTFDVASLDTTVATVKTSRDAVTLNAVAVGSTSITVLARDPTGLNTQLAVRFSVVEEGNPVPAGVVPEQTVDIEEPKVLAVSQYFTDPDGDSLTYEATSSVPTVATVEVSKDRLTISPVAAGVALITVTASDPDSLMAQQTFLARVAAEGSPRIVGQIQNYRIETGVKNSLAVTAYFEDDGEDALIFSASSSDNATVSVEVSDDTVTFEAVAVGEADVSVVATDSDGLSVAQSFNVRVVPAPPEATDTIPDQSVEIDKDVALDVSAYFTDADGDDLTFEAVSSDEAVATVEVSDNTVTISAVAVGTATVTVTATDPSGRMATHTFTATVLTKGHPVAVGNIADQVLRTGDTTTVVVSAYFTDSDGDTLTYEATSSDDDVATVMTEGDTVKVIAVATGTATVTVTAEDPDDLTAEQSFEVQVKGGPPSAVGTIPDQEVEVEGEATVDLTAYFTDQDGDPLTYEAESADSSVATVSVSGSVLTVSGVAEGTAGVTVTATDPENTTAEQSFDAVVVAKGHPRATGKIPDQGVETGETATVNLSGYFSDSDGDTLAYAATSSDEAVATVTVSGETVTISGVAKGTATVTVTATDPGGLTAEQVFEAKVSGTPQASNIPPVDLEVGDEETVDLSEYFTDADGDALTYDAMSSDTTVATVTLSGSVATISAVATGVATVTASATDTDSLTGKQSFRVRVLDEGVPEVTEAIPNWSLTAGQQATLDATEHFSGVSLTYATESSDTSVVVVTVSSNLITIAGVEDGTATVTVTATGRDNISVSQSFSVTVATYEPIDGFVIRSGGGVSLRYVTIGNSGGCITTPRTLGGVRYDIHWTEWQTRTGGTGPWTTVPDTHRTGEICGYNLRNVPAGEYRLAGEISLDGVRGHHRTTNTYTASGSN